MRAVEEGRTKYTAVTGEAELKTKICEDLERRKGTVYEPDEIIVGNGAKQVIYEALLAVLAPGDEVVIPTPYWTS